MTLSGAQTRHRNRELFLLYAPGSLQQGLELHSLVVVEAGVATVVKRLLAVVVARGDVPWPVMILGSEASKLP